MKKGGEIHFGNIPAIREKLLEFWSLISPLCDVVELEIAEHNCLHMARELMAKELEDCGDNITNHTQVTDIILKQADTEYPYIVLTKKSDDCASTPSSSMNNSSSSFSSSSASPSTSDSTPKVIVLRNSPDRVYFYGRYGKTAAGTPYPKATGLKRISDLIDLTAEESDEESFDRQRRIIGRVDFNDDYGWAVGKI